MAAEFIDAMLYANLALSAAILFVLTARASMKRLFGPRIAYGLWMAVPLAGAASFLPAPVIHAPAIAASTDISPALSLPMSAAAIHADSGRHIAEAQLSPFEYGAELLLAIWVVGLVLSAGILALRQKRFIDSLGGLRQRTHDRTTLYLCESANIGPAVVGMFAPRIILPADFETRFNADEQMVVLAHERAHLRRGDAQLNGLVALLRCLCWFNPLVHVAAHYQRRDQEMACDATVLAHLEGRRGAYARALLKAQLVQDALPLGCYWPARSAHPLKARIALLEWSSRNRALRWTGIAAVSLSSLCAGYAAWAAQPPKIIFETAGQARVVAIGQPDRKGIERIFVPFVGAEKSQIQPQISQESTMAKQTSPVAMIGRASAALVLGASPGMSTGGAGLLATPAIAQSAPVQSRGPNSLTGTLGSDAEQATTVTKPQNVSLFVKAESDGSCGVYWNQSRMTSKELLDRAVAKLKADIEKAGGIKNIKIEDLPEVHLRGDINTPYRCIGGTIYTMQFAGYPKVGFISLPPPTQAVKIDPPPSTDTPPSLVDPVKNKVMIASNGAITWNGTPIDLGRLRQYLDQTVTMVPAPELQFQPDAEARYERVDQTLAVIKRAGVTKMGFVGNEQYYNRF
jgi:beta-lactamase regulating signal transducer with metallopeptidase domain/biopolymer transport protein ExbD